MVGLVVFLRVEHGGENIEDIADLKQYDSVDIKAVVDVKAGDDIEAGVNIKDIVDTEGGDDTKSGDYTEAAW